MSMGSRKVNTEGIDEELLIASIGRRKQDGTLYRAQEPPVPAPEEESVPETEPPPTASPSREKVQKDIARRKRQEDDYSGLFLRRNEIKTRQCVVSIRPRACFSPSYNKVKSQTKHVWLLTLL